MILLICKFFYQNFKYFKGNSTPVFKLSSFLHFYKLYSAYVKYFKTLVYVNEYVKTFVYFHKYLKTCLYVYHNLKTFFFRFKFFFRNPKDNFDCKTENDIENHNCRSVLCCNRDNFNSFMVG